MLHPKHHLYLHVISAQNTVVYFRIISSAKGVKMDYKSTAYHITFFQLVISHYPLLLLIRNPKIIQICFIFILCCQTGICQISFFVVPFLQSTIIEHLQIVLNDERNNIVFQALLKHDQSAHTTVSILKWMNPLKLHMEVQNILKGLFWNRWCHSSKPSEVL